MKRLLKGAFLTFALATAATVAHASGISYTCAANINADSGINLCSSINSVVAGDYKSIFSNANASIYVEFADNNGLGQTMQVINTVSYSSYLTALTANSSGDAVDTAALASLSATEPSLYNGAGVGLTSALDSALGFTGYGVDSAFNVCTIGSSGCYNAVIQLNDPTDLAAETGGQTYYYGTGTQTANQYSLSSVLQHETNEVLGTISCVSVGDSTLIDGCGNNTPSAVDLFRYSANGTHVLEDTTPGAYFSYDGGVTAGAPVYNTNATGEDYADYASTGASTCQYVQTTQGCLGADQSISTDGGSEVNILDAVGYNLNSNTNPAPTPEPSTLLLFGTAALAFAGLVRHRAIRA